MGYNPKLWGPEGWHFIHFIALNYPLSPTKQDKINYIKFLESLQFILPCEGCAFNFSEKLKSHPPNLDNRESFFRWTVDVHNQVNTENGKPKISYEEALKKVSRKREWDILKESFIISASLYLIVLNVLLLKRK